MSPWPFFPHTSHTLPLTWHHTKLFCGLGSKLFQVLNFHFFADPSTNWVQKNSTSSQTNVSLTSFPPYIPHIAPNMAPYEAILRVGLKAFPGFEFQFLCWPKHKLRVKKQHFLPSQCLLDFFSPHTSRTLPLTWHHTKLFLWVGLKVFQVLKSNSCPDGSTNWVQKTALPPKPMFPCPSFAHTSRTLPLTWHHTKLFCEVGLKVFQVLKSNSCPDGSTNWVQKHSTCPFCPWCCAALTWHDNIFCLFA